MQSTLYSKYELRTMKYVYDIHHHIVGSAAILPERENPKIIQNSPLKNKPGLFCYSARNGGILLKTLP